ncbi:carbohydrate ABC transporter permease [Lacrimispora brassicae]
MARKMRGTESRGKQLKAAAMFSPSILLLAMFFIGPMFMTVMFSMTNLTLTGSQAASTHFVGFSNFTQIFKDPKIGKILFNTIVFLFFSGIIGQQCLGFIIAYLMKKKNRFVRSFVGFTVIAGWITPEIVCAFMFSAFFHESGTANHLLGALGLKPVVWLFSFPMVSVVIANIWKGSAYSMMMFQASLDSISDDVVEAAKIDGAGKWAILTRITLPMIKNTMATTFVIVTLSTLGAFGLIFGMTGGGPGMSSTTLSIYMYQKAFSAYQIGYGMAIALLILVIGVIFSLVYTKLIKANN